MSVVHPRQLEPGGTVRVVAPSLSGRLVRGLDTELIRARLGSLGLTVEFGRYVAELDELGSSSIASRIADLHEAFEDPAVTGILTLIGGYTTNELLPHLDWELIANHPTLLCGYSDVSAFQLAALRCAGLVTYYGPHWSTFGMRDGFEETLRWFAQAAGAGGRLELEHAAVWSDDEWFLDQDAREWLTTDGPWVLRPGQAAGRVICAHLNTLLMLAGTRFLPELADCIVMVEASGTGGPAEFARDLAALLQLPGAGRIAGLLIGRFQRAGRMDRETLTAVVDRQPGLRGLPVAANLDFGHTMPMATIPIGAWGVLAADAGDVRLAFERD